MQRNCVDKSYNGGDRKNGGRLVYSAKMSMALDRPDRGRDIIRYACNYIAGNGGVVIMKRCCMIAFTGTRLHEESTHCNNGKKNHNNGDAFT